MVKNMKNMSTPKQWQKPKKKKYVNSKPYILYALELEDGYWYIGTTVNLEKRFEQHVIGEGASWTKVHKPIRVHESRLTKITKLSRVAKLEDQMTLDYVLLYGEANVRGGKWCRVIYPNYPK